MLNICTLKNLGTESHETGLHHNYDSMKTPNTIVVVHQNWKYGLNFAGNQEDPVWICVYFVRYIFGLLGFLVRFVYSCLNYRFCNLCLDGVFGQMVHFHVYVNVTVGKVCQVDGSHFVLNVDSSSLPVLICTSMLLLTFLSLDFLLQGGFNLDLVVFPAPDWFHLCSPAFRYKEFCLVSSCLFVLSFCEF